MFLGIIADKSLRGLDDIPCIIMQVLECVQDVAFHFRLVETLMLFKENLWIVSVSNNLQVIYTFGMNSCVYNNGGDILANITEN